MYLTSMYLTLIGINNLNFRQLFRSSVRNSTGLHD